MGGEAYTYKAANDYCDAASWTACLLKGSAIQQRASSRSCSRHKLNAISMHVCNTNPKIWIERTFVEKKGVVVRPTST